MKPTIDDLVISAFAAALILLSGCAMNPAQQTVAYKTLYGVEVATTGAYDGYSTAVAKGLLPTNDVPAISHAFDKFQSSLGLAIALARNDTNAVAPPDVVSDSASVVTLISGVKTK